MACYDMHTLNLFSGFDGRLYLQKQSLWSHIMHTGNLDIWAKTDMMILPWYALRGSSSTMEDWIQAAIILWVNK